MENPNGEGGWMDGWIALLVFFFFFSFLDHDSLSFPFALRRSSRSS